jgi:hypothetical protein
MQTSFVIYVALGVWQFTTPDLLTAGNAGVLVIYAYQWVVAAALIGVALKDRLAWWIAFVADALGATGSLTSEHPHATEFLRVTSILALGRLTLLITPWIRAHVGFRSVLRKRRVEPG